VHDREWTFGVVPRRLVDEVQLQAVLYPLTGRLGARNMPLADEEQIIRESTALLVDLWRSRLSSLTELGWVPDPGSPNSATYCRNCLPTFATATPRTRTCCRRYICPFCWARWVRSVWLNIEKAFPKPAKNGDSAIFPFHLVEHYHTLTVPPLPDDAVNWNPVTWIGAYVKELVSYRGEAIRRIQAPGAFSLTTVEPVRRGWRIRHRRLYKVAADYEIEEDTLRGYVTRHERPSKTVIAKTVGRVCRYPRCLLRGDPERVFEWLTARQHFPTRLAAAFGAFRKKGKI